MKFKNLKAPLAAALLLSTVMTATAQTCPCGPGTRVTGQALVALLGTKTVCGQLKDDTWQEFHSGTTAAGGSLIDYKRGPNDPVDPSKQVGNWSVQNVGAADSYVVYDYGSGGAYSFAVCQAGGSVSFCGITPPNAAVTNTRSSRGAVAGSNVTGATLINGQNACPASLRRAR